MPVTLTALTQAAIEGLRDRESVEVTHFPFKVGRERRLPGTEPPAPEGMARLAGLVERRLGHAPELNDLYVIEWPSPEGFHISREHFAIDRDGDRYVVTDRGSANGTQVGATTLGIDAAFREAEIQGGDVIVLGGSHSPYRYRFGASAAETMATGPGYDSGRGGSGVGGR